MIILNFTHPLTESQNQQIEMLTKTDITSVHHIPCQFDNQQPLLPQIDALLNKVPLTPQEWQNLPILVNPPGLAAAAAALLAECHGRMGYFPSLIRIRPIDGSPLPRFEIAEILNLQAVRELSRTRR